MIVAISETKAHSVAQVVWNHVAQVSLELMEILLTQTPKSWDYSSKPEFFLSSVHCGTYPDVSRRRSLGGGSFEKLVHLTTWLPEVGMTGPRRILELVLP